MCGQHNEHVIQLIWLLCILPSFMEEIVMITIIITFCLKGVDYKMWPEFKR